MMPGGRVNERQMKLMMKRLGMTTAPIENVEEVIIRTRDQEHVLKAPEVTVLTVQGVRTYQVVGEPTIRPRTASSPSSGPESPSVAAAPAGPPAEDIQLVVEQTGVSRAEAIEALDAAGGAPAEAILSLLSRRGGGDR
ncbi:MAG: nascent polypeptide-associated complex protein [Thermoplasmata archaeon]|nr:nascent polypeptide-associated complex protein [Thermoplasmata archaeon]